MPDRSLPTSGETSQPAPAPPAELSSDLKLAIRDEVERVVSRKFATYSKIALVLAGILGFATWASVFVKTKELVKAEVDSLIKQTDSETGAKHALDTLLNRAIVTADLISLRKPKPAAPDRGVEPAEGPPQKVLDLSYEEWARLKKWIQDEKLDEGDFVDALAVLGAQEDSRTADDAKDFLAEMLDPPAFSQYHWMLEYPRKRLAILQTYRHPGLGPAALGVAQSDKSPRDLRLAALAYIKATLYRDAIEGLAPLLENGGDAELQMRALLACARLDPLDPKVDHAVEHLIGLPVGEKTVEDLIRLATEIGYAPMLADERVQESVRQQLEAQRAKSAMRLLDAAFAHGAYLVVLGSDTVAIMVPSQSRPYEAFGASKARFSELRPYWSLLEDAAARGDRAKIELLAPRSCARKGLQSLQVTLGPSARLVLSKLPALDGAKISELTLTRSSDAEMNRRNTLTALWKDGTGGRATGDVAGLSGGGFKFSLPKEFNSDSCID